MSALVKLVSEHWAHVAPLLAMPANEADYDRLVGQLDEILAEVGDDDDHPLALLASRMADLVEAYDEQNRPMPPVTGADALRYIMEERGLSQSEVPEVGAQSVVSEILSGKRQINLRQARALSERFLLPASVFLSL
ncbi:helix-turn-helix domain-containing protein [Rhizobium binae]|uniref:helix-turn-helix domain-containing protein n=1 Tax=Rhizobium binae TaxID=1138190 RepID=UPI001C82EC00|nr:transcriptional regulator [Rhizobium binae]MBX4925936.1 transcriptional regulator [Rhizobium binae]MBX4937786.1 transcriptional regulator [Rhizobium binae]MBX4943801.1 transcriptional regulator [Rhizobium binae]MBX4978971.1 transcriptional regulator [Rhizobium binae]